MANVEHINRLFEETGPAMNDVDSVYRTDEFQWTLFFDEERSVDFEFDMPQQKLVLTTNVGCPPEESRSSLFGLLLTYNSLRSDNGGVMMAITGTEIDDQVVQTFELNAAELQLQTLQNVVRNFHQKAELWRQAIQNHSSTDDQKPDSELRLGGGAIQV